MSGEGAVPKKGLTEIERERDLLISLGRLSVLELRFRLAVITSVLREAQVSGDERWKVLVKPQRRVNAVLVRKLAERRHRRREPEPSPVRVKVAPARLVPKTLSVWDDQTTEVTNGPG